VTRLGLIALAACTGASASAPEHAPTITLAAIPASELCATHGRFAIDREHVAISDPTVRIVAPNTRGDAAAVRFAHVTSSATTRNLRSGATRDQIGLKLRAQDSCNVVYVMWRDDKGKLDVSIKHNPGKRTNGECGNGGYKKLRPKLVTAVPAFGDRSHELRAEIVDDELTAWIDDRLAWRGPLPADAQSIVGPAGLRSDNVAFDMELFAVRTNGNQRCRRADDGPD
jgi:hypothetical protein